MGLDLAPLQTAVSDADIDAYRRDRGLPVLRRQRSLSPVVAVAGAAAAAAVGWLIGLEASALAHLPIDTLPLGLLPILLAALSAVAMFTGSARLYRRRGGLEPPDAATIRMRRFAAANGLEVGGATPPATGLLAGGDHTVRMGDSLRSITPPDRRFSVSNLEIVEHVGDRTASTPYTFLSVPLDRDLPHLVLDAVANDGLLSSLPGAPGAGQTFSLEGDFGRHFRVHCPPGAERDALTFFTPDLMAVLIDHAADFDVEVVERTAHFFTDRTLDLSRASSWQTIDPLLEHVLPKVHRSSRERLSDAEAPAPPRLRRRRSVPAWLYSTAGAVAVVALMLLLRQL